MAFGVILLILPALVSAKLSIYIVGEMKSEIKGEVEEDASKVTVYANGHDVGIITDTERKTFDLSNDKLKGAVALTLGKLPDNVYLRSPTPWGDLYKKYGWHQVTRNLTLIQYNRSNISFKRIIIAEQIFENNSSKKTIVNVGISKEVQNTVSSSWRTEGELSVREKISHNINLKVFEVGRMTSFSYDSSFGKFTKQSGTVTVGATSSMEVVLEPGQSVITQLQVTRSIIQLRLVYEARLSGYIALNYADSYRGHHFWARSLKFTMKNANINNHKRSVEILNIEFYSGSKVIVLDEMQGNKLIEVAF